MAILTELLNEFGLFKVDRVVMIPSMILAFCSFFLPVAIYLFGRGKRSGVPVVERDWFRKLILACCFSGSHFDPGIVRIVGTITNEMIAVANSLGK